MSCQVTLASYNNYIYLMRGDNWITMFTSLVYIYEYIYTHLYAYIEPLRGVKAKLFYVLIHLYAHRTVSLWHLELIHYYNLESYKIESSSVILVFMKHIQVNMFLIHAVWSVVHFMFGPGVEWYKNIKKVVNIYRCTIYLSTQSNPLSTFCLDPGLNDIRS